MVTQKVKSISEYEKAIRALRRQVDKLGIIKELKARRYYTKPSLVNRELRKQQKKRAQLTSKRPRTPSYV
jgi:ribosomal protein S21